MHYLLIPLGSHGDVHPFIGMGLALRRRGHEVTVITNGHFRGLVERAGLPFVECGDAELYRRAMLDPDLWNPRRSFDVVMQMVLEGTESLYHLVGEHIHPGRTLMVGATLAWGALLAREKHGYPMVSVHLAPTIFPSVYLSPRMPMGNLPAGSPRWLKRAWWALVKHAVNRRLRPPLNALRQTRDLPPVRDTLAWWNSPDGVLGLWPDWFGPVQPDWPPQVHLAGFPLYDERDLATELPAAIAPWLEQDDPAQKPIVFTPGSAMLHGQHFFATAVEACARLQRRGIFLTRFAEQLPRPLPDFIRHADYVPLSRILPHAAALVQHGGVGTTAQGLAAGIPQLVVPFSHDQPDNAVRVQRLGAGDCLPAKRLDARRMADKLHALLTTPGVWQSAQACAQKIAATDALGDICDYLAAIAAQNNLA